MDPSEITKYIMTAYEGVDHVAAGDDSFFFCDPGRKLPVNQRLPFATLMTSDKYDQASNLSRPAVYRLNVGIDKVTYRRHFGDPPSPSETGGVLDTGHDYTVLDRIIPHPVYASMAWVCVLSPSAATFETVKPLLAEAYKVALTRYERYVAHS